MEKKGITISPQDFSSDITSERSKIVRRAIVSASKEHREAINHDASYQHQYQTEAQFAAKIPFSKKVKLIATEEQDHNQEVTRMLEKVYIGNNTYVNLTDCRDLLDMSAQEAEKILPYDVPSNEAVLAVNNYLETNHITNKDEYLAEQFKKIVTRDPSADKKLADIMLQPYSNSLADRIVYADNLALYTDKDNTSNYVLRDYNTQEFSSYNKHLLETKTNTQTMLSPALLAQRQNHER